MHISRKAFFGILLLTLCLLLSACIRTDTVSPHQVLEALCQAETPLPAGRIYVLSAPQDSTRHPSDNLLAATFGNGCLPPEMDQVADAAFFLSYTHPCELAVFHCKTADGTDQVAEMCLRRLDSIKQYRTNSSTEEAYAAYLENACVTVRGKWVILLVSSDPATALRTFKRCV